MHKLRLVEVPEAIDKTMTKEANIKENNWGVAKHKTNRHIGKHSHR